jgi:hypothetical protein
MPIIGVIASSAKGAPGIPTIGTATNVGTGRAYNNGAATVTFTAGAGATATSFTATSSPGGFTATGASSPLTVAGLQSSVSYTFTVTATNAAGTSAASSASNSITATTVPQAPTIGTATRTNSTTVSLAFTAGATGGSTITSYTATSSPSVALTTSGTTSPLTLTGTFVQGQAYTFSIVATNANGSSSSSSASNSITVNPFPTLGAFSVSTNYPFNYYGIGAGSTNNDLVTAGGTNGQNSINQSYYWNGSSWSSKSGMASWSMYKTYLVGTDGSNFQIVSNAQGNGNETKFSTATGLWSAGTNLPTNAGINYATIGFTDGNKVHATAQQTTGSTGYIRTGTGAFTAASATKPEGTGGYAVGDRTNNNGYVWFDNGGSTYKLSGYNGTYSVYTDFGYRNSTIWAAGVIWGIMNENSGSTVNYLNTSTAAFVSTGITGPTSGTLGYTWTSFGWAAYGNELHMFGGRRSSPPDPSFPGVNLHYKANITT